MAFQLTAAPWRRKTYPLTDQQVEGSLPQVASLQPSKILGPPAQKVRPADMVCFRYHRTCFARARWSVLGPERYLDSLLAGKERSGRVIEHRYWRHPTI